jgi:excisionase family DNA binding protein
MEHVTRSRRHDPRRAKTHHSYTIAEAATLYAVHRNTVRNWIRNGLETLKAGGQALILGSALRDFLARQRAARRVRCPPGMMFCLKCRDARQPPEGLVELVPVTSTTGNLRGLCPVCGGLMHRRANLSRIAEAGFPFLASNAGADGPN